MVGWGNVWVVCHTVAFGNVLKNNFKKKGGILKTWHHPKDNTVFPRMPNCCSPVTRMRCVASLKTAVWCSCSRRAVPLCLGSEVWAWQKRSKWRWRWYRLCTTRWTRCCIAWSLFPTAGPRSWTSFWTSAGWNRVSVRSVCANTSRCSPSAHSHSLPQSYFSALLWGFWYFPLRMCLIKTALLISVVNVFSLGLRSGLGGSCTKIHV